MPGLAQIPLISGGHLDINLKEGEPLFVVGQNGTGKSGLMHYLSTRVGNPIRIILGHRSNTLNSASPDMTISSRRIFDNQHLNLKIQPQYRWLDQIGATSVSATLFDVFVAENARNRRYTEASLVGDDLGKQAAAAMRSPLTDLNQLLDRCGISVQMRISNQEELEAVRGGFHYAANKMSDGERNALLLAGQVLTVEPGTSLLIDEPERHLHRSIMTPLITGLFALRPDCFYAVATHDLELASEVLGAQTLIVRDCSFAADLAVAWDADLLPTGVGVSDDIKTAILGARRKIVFVEGTATSLDRALYQLLFPSVSVVPQNSCRDVGNAVRGVRSSAALAWVTAFGVIDNDGRPASELATLEAEGVYPLAVNTVESVYYHPTIVRLVAERRVRFMGGEVDAMLADAQAQTIAAVRPRAKYLATRRAHHKVRSMIFDQLPDDSSIERGEPVAISIDTAAELSVFEAELDSFIATNDWTSIIKRFGVKNTGATNGIARALTLSVADYEEAVRRTIVENSVARLAALTFFGNLPAALGV